MTAASSSRSGGACIPSSDGDDDQVEDGDQVEEENKDEDEVETEDEDAGGNEDGVKDENGNDDEDEVKGEGETFVTSAHCRADELFESSLAANCNGGIENQ